MDRTCVVPECDRQPRSPGSAMCGLHYRRMRENGSTDKPPFRSRKSTRCAVDGCAKKPYGTLCSTHRARVRRHGDPHAVMWPTPGPASYRSVHRLLEKTRGRADGQDCARCGKQAAQWAYDHRCSNEQIGTNGRPFTTHLDHYSPMCLPCHRAFDREAHDDTDICALGERISS